jgi:hypothetical protein
MFGFWPSNRFGGANVKEVQVLDINHGDTIFLEPEDDSSPYIEREVSETRYNPKRRLVSLYYVGMLGGDNFGADAMIHKKVK